MSPIFFSGRRTTTDVGETDAFSSRSGIKVNNDVITRRARGITAAGIGGWGSPRGVFIDSRRAGGRESSCAAAFARAKYVSRASVMPCARSFAADASAAYSAASDDDATTAATKRLYCFYYCVYAAAAATHSNSCAPSADGHTTLSSSSSSTSVRPSVRLFVCVAAAALL